MSSLRPQFQSGPTRPKQHNIVKHKCAALGREVFSAIESAEVQYSSAQCSAVQYSTVQHNVVKHSTV